MITLERFGRNDYEQLISWIKDEEMLMQFGGPNFRFPLTVEQLDHSQADPRRHSFKVVSEQTKKTIGHCEVYLQEDCAKLARIIIGDD